MQKVVQDDWNPTLRTVTSTLAVSTRSLRTETIHSDVCGFGWRFGVSLDSNTANGSTYLVGQDFAVSLFFDLHLLSSSSFTGLSVSTSLNSVTNGIRQKTLTTVRNQSGQNGVQLGRYEIQGIASEVVFELTVMFPKSLGLKFPSLRPQLLGVLEDSFFGKDPLDIKFYAFSRRAIDRGASHPKSLYASSTILTGHSGYLNGLVGGESFLRSPCVSIDGYRSEEESAGNSDLESDSEDAPPGDAASQNSDEDLLKKPAYVLPSKANGKLAIPGGTCPRTGRIIILKDIAFTTWKALLWYLYTGCLSFSPLSSMPHHTASVSASSSLPLLPQCSPKSMYRLADMVGLDDIKQLALEQIHSSLSSANIIEEAFSQFTSRDPAIRDMEVDVFIKHMPMVAHDLDTMLGRVVKGEMLHSLGTLQMIVFRLSEVKTQTEGCNTPKASSVSAKASLPAAAVIANVEPATTPISQGKRRNPGKYK